MRYRNIKTGVEIETFGTISGKDWEECPSSQPVLKEEVKKPAQKKSKSAKTKTSRK